MKTAPFFPHLSQSTVFIMASDEPMLFQPIEQLTPTHLNQHQFVSDLIATFQCAMMLMSKPEDSIVLFDLFQQQPWQDILRWHHQLFARIIPDLIPYDHLYYVNRESFYEDLPEFKQDTMTICQISHSNYRLYQDPKWLQVSQQSSSKMLLARNAAQFNIPIPESITLSKAELDGQTAADFFVKHGDNVLIKIMGLGGSHNVKAVKSIADAQEFLAEFPLDLELVLQQKLNLQHYREMAADLIISDDKVVIDNIRNVLLNNGMWIGNHLNSNITLSEDHLAILHNVGQYIQQLGYHHPDGLNCGIDFFVKDEQLLISEINARWTGGLIPTKTYQRLSLNQVDGYTFFDTISLSKLDAYQQFVEQHLYQKTNQNFSIVPFGFSPYVQVIDGDERIYVWMMITGDINAFTQAKDLALGTDQLAVAKKIKPIK